MKKHPNNKNRTEVDSPLAGEAKSTQPGGNKPERAAGMDSPNAGTQAGPADQHKPADSPPNEAQVAAQRAQKDAELAAALRTMTAALKEGQNRRFMVALVGYWIEGIPYFASGLTFSADAIPEVHLTDEGLTCLAFFQPELLCEETVRKNGIIVVELGGPPVAAVGVRVDIRARDIWYVTEFIRGEHHYLFHASGIRARATAFMEEINAWRARRK